MNHAILKSPEHTDDYSWLRQSSDFERIADHRPNCISQNQRISEIDDLLHHY